MPPPAAFNRFRPQPQPKNSEATPTADVITRDVLAFLDQQGYAAWRQPNEGRYDPDRQQWYPHPNARRGVPDIIGFRRAPVSLSKSPELVVVLSSRADLFPQHSRPGGRHQTARPVGSTGAPTTTSRLARRPAPGAKRCPWPAGPSKASRRATGLR